MAESHDDGHGPTLVLNWTSNLVTAFWVLAAVYGWAPRSLLVVAAWSSLALAVVTGALHVMLWLWGDMDRPRFFYRQRSPARGDTE